MATLRIVGQADFKQALSDAKKASDQIKQMFSGININLGGSSQNTLSNLSREVQQFSSTTVSGIQKVQRVYDGLAEKVEKASTVITNTKDAYGSVHQTVEKLTKDGEQYETVQETITTNYEKMAKEAKQAAEKQAKAQELLNKTNSQNSRSAESLSKNYSNLSRSIADLSKSYPEGTFQNLQTEVSNAKAEIESIRQAIANGSITTEEATRRLDDARDRYASLQRQLAETRAETNKLENSTNILGDSLTHIVEKIIAWQVINAGVASVIRSFRNALSTLKDVDSELASIQKVTNQSEYEMKQLGDAVYETASKYGVSASAATEMLDASAEFAKAGYDNYAALAELATKTQLVGDVNSDTASKFLISADAAYKLKGNVDELSTVLDKANFIENNYATSIEKIAEGLPNVASVASMANMSLDELTAALGTITAVTQESGSKASYALRALILNIIGDTQTEIDEGVTWTKDEIKSLQDVISEFANEELRMAINAGKILNPTEVLSALAEAYETGALTEAKLADIESKLGGKLRTNQLDALIKNFDMFEEMLDGVSESAGSADKEIDIMLDTWEAKTNILSNKWTELISNIVNTDGIKGALDFITVTVELLNTKLGQSVIVVGTLSTLIHTLYKTLEKKGAIDFFSNIISQATSASGAIIALNTAFVTSPIFLLTAGVAATYGAVQLFQYLHVTVDEATASLKEANAQLEELTSDDGEYSDLISRAEQLNEVEQARLRILEQQRKEYEKQAQDAKNQWIKSWRNENDSDKSGEYANGITSRIKSIRSSGLDNSDMYALLNQLADDSADRYIGLRQIVDYGGSLTDDEQRYLDTYERLQVAIKSIREQVEPTTESISEYVVEQEVAAASSTRTAEELQDLAKELKANEAAYDAAVAAEKEYTESGTISSKTLQALINDAGTRIELLQDENGNLAINAENLRTVVEATADDVAATKNQISEYDQSIDATKARQNALVALAKSEGDVEKATYDDIAAITIFNNTRLSVSDKIAALRNLALAAGISADAINSVVNGSVASYNGSASDALAYIQSGGTDYGAYLDNQKNYTIQSWYERIFENIGEESTSTSSKSSSGSSGSSTKDKKLESLKDVVTLRKSELTLLKAQDAPESAQIAKQREIQAALHDEAKYLRSIKGDQSDINALSSEWLEIQSSINSTTLTDAKNRVSLLESELSLLQAQDASSDDIIAKRKEIQAALHNEAELLRKTGGEQSEINSLSKEWWSQQKEINSLLEDATDYLSELTSALKESYNTEKVAIDSQIDAVQARIDALKDEKSTKEDTLKIDEKILAVQEAQKSLEDASKERTIRRYNAESGKFEWVADEKNIKSAQETLDAAVKALEEAQSNKEYNDKLSALEAEKDALNAQKEQLEKRYNNLADALDAAQNPTRAIQEILDDLAENITPELRAVLLENKSLFESLGIDVSKLSESVEKATEYIAKSASGATYTITSEAGVNFVENSKNGDTLTGSDGSSWVNNNGTITITNKYGDKLDVSQPSETSSSSATAQSVGTSATSSSYSKVQSDGTAEAGLAIGTNVITNGGVYTITGINDSGGYTSERVANVSIAGSDGKAESGLSAGDVVKTNGGYYKITAVKADGTYESEKVVYDNGGILRGMGGIKATTQDEAVIPPDIVSKMLSPVADATFSERLNELRYFYGASSKIPASIIGASNKSVTNHSGAEYHIGNITMSEDKAKTTTVYDLAQMSRSLIIRGFSN